jgi:hypothetical protein
VSQSSWVPGLWVKLQGVGSTPRNVLVSVISFSGNDLRTANAIQAGLDSFRRTSTSEYGRDSGKSRADPKSTSFVYFAVGSCVLTLQARNELLKIANEARSVKGYLIQVKEIHRFFRTCRDKSGFEYASGSVRGCIPGRDCRYPLIHVLTAGAVGESRPAAFNGSPQGRAENRRAEIRTSDKRGVFRGVKFRR